MGDPIEWEKLTKEELRERESSPARSVWLEDEGKFRIEVPFHASTSLRLHELGHATLGHKKSADLGELTRQELDAQSWAYDRMGRKLSEHDLEWLAWKAYTETGWGVRPKDVYDLMLGLAGDYDIELSPTDKKELWAYVMGIYKQERPKNV